MKMLGTVTIAMLLFLTPAYAFSSSLGHLRLSLVQGDVQVKTPEAGEWGIASVNLPLAEGDQVWVPAGSRAELQLNNGTYVRLDQNSSLQILSLDRNSSQFYLPQGRSYIYYNAPKGSVLQIDTPDASSRTFNRASFRVDIGDSYTDVAVYQGYLETENSVGKARITAGQMVSLGQDSYGEVAPLGSADDWDNWNKMRNRRLLARSNGGARYLPVELRAYSADLDNSGRWVRVPEYGYVWTPTVDIDDNWSPYRAGRWIWRDGEYVWIASESWGWAPYHYGRWSYVASVGWCWAPPAEREVYWGPGYVGWVRTPEYVAWVPLAPGEVYYGRGNYGPHSVNITNVNVTQVNVTNVYKNVYVNRGVTVVNRNTFNTPSPVVVNVNKNVIQRNLFVKNNISIGTPDIKPTKASYFASARAVPQAKMPPPRVRDLRVQELRHARPLVKDHDKSVLAPGTKPVNLPVHVVSTPRTPGKGEPALTPVPPAQGGKPTATSVPLPRGEQPQLKPAARGRAGAPSLPAPRGASPWSHPADNRKTVAPGAPASAPSAVQPAQRSKSGAPAVSVPLRAEQAPKLQPAERRRPAAPERAVPRLQQSPMQPPGEINPGAPAGSTPKKDQPQVQPAEKTQVRAPGTQAPRVARPQAPLVEKRKAVAPAEPEAKDKNIPHNPDQGPRSR